MTPRVVRSGRSSGGQVLIVFGLALFVIIGMMSISVDGGYGFVQHRRAQNGADFAAVAATRALSSYCASTAPTPPLDQYVQNLIQDSIDLNATNVGKRWSGTYLDRNSVPLGPMPDPQSGTPIPPGQTVPFGTCGVAIRVSPSWPSYLAHAVGVDTLSNVASATAVSKPVAGLDLGIMALDEINPHTLFGGGTGTFRVNGDLFLNSRLTHRSVFSGSFFVVDPVTSISYTDVIDVKGTSNLSVAGVVSSATPINEYPIDGCFKSLDNTPPPWGAGPRPVGAPPYHVPASPPSPSSGVYCSNEGGGAQFAYDQFKSGQPLKSDPLDAVAAPGAPVDPMNDRSTGLCPGETAATIPVNPAPSFAFVPSIGAVAMVYQPGVYTVPITLDVPGWNYALADCADPANPALPMGSRLPGTYRFEGGLTLAPSAGAQIYAHNVTIGLGRPVLTTDNVDLATGVGNGAPCLPFDAPDTQAPPVFGTPCSGGTRGALMQRLWPTGAGPLKSGTGMNYSLMMGGAGTISQTAATSGPFRNIAIYQGHKLFGGPPIVANLGFDARPGDSATISIDGVVYDTTDPARASDQLYTYDDYAPARAGGVLQTGFGMGGTGSAPSSRGVVTINGTAIVQIFNTDGNVPPPGASTSITINARPFSLPSSGPAALQL